MIAVFLFRETLLLVTTDLEIETSEGWRPARAHVVSLGGGRFRASVRLPLAAPADDANLRFEGRTVRGVVKATERDARVAREKVVFEFRTA
jgi:hypothetical protein